MLEGLFSIGTDVISVTTMFSIKPLTDQLESSIPLLLGREIPLVVRPVADMAMSFTGSVAFLLCNLGEHVAAQREPVASLFPSPCRSEGEKSDQTSTETSFPDRLRSRDRQAFPAAKS
ncbi:hypothetical protein KIL84_001767 [Mauremys mutica]|uniref:Uncharacterized protein n=1 Tax=Mauremys mutica TaxID=74926 RepID=A0A9D3XK82_9SAUR|nr:hypothetical protein KIL84_001767 [Mauremys mutica]